MEEALYDTAVIRRSAGTNGVDRSPHETTILDVRRLLETYGLGARMLEAAKGYPQKQGLSLRAAGWWMPRQRMQVASREHPIRVIKQQFVYTKVRCRGLAKTSAGADLFALSNLWMTRRQFLPAMGRKQSPRNALPL